MSHYSGISMGLLFESLGVINRLLIVPYWNFTQAYAVFTMTLNCLHSLAMFWPLMIIKIPV